MCSRAEIKAINEINKPAENMMLVKRSESIATVLLDTMGNVIEGDQLAYRSLWCMTYVLDVHTESTMLKTTANAVEDDQLAFEHYGANRSTALVSLKSMVPIGL